MVSVVVTTYNHVNFIKQCIDGILLQKTNFPLEIILGEDESSDGTREICKEYSKKHPDIIRLFLRNRKDVIYINGSATGRYNFIENLKVCKGKYIALCEGDDYWTDPLKLQKQVDFLEKHSNYSMCFHSVYNLKNKKIIEEFPSNELATTFELKDIFSQWFIPTCSMLFRNKIEIPKWFADVISGDFTLHFLIAEKGEIYFLKENMGVYRIHDRGVSRFHFGFTKAIGMIRLYTYLDLHFKGRYRKLIDRQIKYEINRYVIAPAVEKAVNKIKKNYESKKIIKLERKIRKLFGKN